MLRLTIQDPLCMHRGPESDLNLQCAGQCDEHKLVLIRGSDYSVHQMHPHLIC